jgi:hypothetical protein
MLGLEISGTGLGAIERVADMLATSTLGGRFEVNNCGNTPELPYWQPIENVMIGCDEDTAEDYECDGLCVVTLVIARPAEYPTDTGFDEFGLARWHMSVADTMTAQFREV